ncbi:MAG: autotransporter-associated beta strand repeat-containing protein, partial [Saezia sp.]
MLLKEKRAVLNQNGGRCLKSSFELKKLTRGIQHMLLTSSLFVIGGSFLSPQASAEGVWQGTVSDAWDLPGNWDSGGVPLSTTNVVIDTNGAPNTPKITTSDAAAHGASIGDQAGATGVLDVTGVGAIWNQVDILYVGNLGTGTLNMTNRGMVATGGVAYVGYEAGAVGTVLVDGAGARWSIGANSYVGEKGMGTVILDHSATLITGAYVTIGSQVGSNGKILVANVASMTSADSLLVGKSGQGELTVSTGGRTSNGGITIAQDSGSKGVVNIGAASTDAAQAVGILDLPRVSFGSGDGQLVFNHTDLTGNYIFSPSIEGTKGDVRMYGGVTTFARGNTYGGNTTVYGGTLMVTNTSGSATGSSAVKVEAGGTFGGTGVISKVVTVDGALRPGAFSKPGVLTVGGLIMNAGSTVYFRLNEAGDDLSTENDRIVVQGDLVVDATSTVDAVINAAGRYLLIDYSGSRTGAFNSTVNTSTDLSGLTLGSTTLDYSVGNKVYLDVGSASGAALVYWDGTNSGSGTSMGAGGTATWDSTAVNWVDSSGGTPGIWGGVVGVFAGTAGIVSIDGSQKFDTLQFLTGGYVLNPGAAGALEIEPDGSNTASAINIGRDLTVTINAPIVDGTTANNKLNIVGGGTVGLLGTNTYSGGTLVFRSTVVANSNDSFGTGNIELNTGTIRYASNFDINGPRQVILSGSGDIFDTNGFSSSINTVVSGVSALYKAGAGTLTLTNVDTYTGATYVNAGTLALSGNGTISGSAFVEVDTGAVFDI